MYPIIFDDKDLFHCNSGFSGANSMLGEVRCQFFIIRKMSKQVFSASNSEWVVYYRTLHEIAETRDTDAARLDAGFFC